MASTLHGTVGIRNERAVAHTDQVEVAWIGARPAWLESEATASALAPFTITSAVTSSTHIVHLARQAPETVAGVRRAHSDAAFVVDLGFASSMSGAALLDAAQADLALVESEKDAAARMRATRA